MYVCMHVYTHTYIYVYTHAHVDLSACPPAQFCAMWFLQNKNSFTKCDQSCD